VEDLILKEVRAVIRSMLKIIINKKINLLMVILLFIDQEISRQQKEKDLPIEEKERKKAEKETGEIKVEKEERREREVEAMREDSMIGKEVDLERGEGRDHDCEDLIIFEDC